VRGVSGIAPPSLEPAGAAGISCANCEEPVGPMHYRILGRAMCPECARLIATVMDNNRFAARPFFTGALAGLGAAIAFALLWALIAKVTHYRGGLIAIFTGTFVSLAVLKGSGGRRGAHMQALSIVLSLFGIWLGKGLCATWSFFQFFESDIKELGWSATGAHAIIFLLGFYLMFTPIDFLWYGFAIYDSWRRLRPIRIAIEGPYSSPSSQSGGGLQFESAEIMHPRPASEPPR
jgi:hypothetical protein